jgi:hypothetical protein
MTEASPSATPGFIGERCATFNRSSLENRLRLCAQIVSLTATLFPFAAKVQPGDDEYAAIGHTPIVLKKP